jgi:hypothetical protein
MCIRSTWLGRLVLATVFIGVLGLASPRTPAIAQVEPDDYDIPNGHFYTQAHPAGTKGEGYSVTNSFGIPFWDAYLARGAWQEVGYPLSRRYIRDGRVSQSFQHGTLVWDPKAARLELRPNRRIREIPSTARVPETAHRVAGASEKVPWSGWWWSVSGVGPALDAIGGPLWKYDRAVETMTGANPGTRDWEAQELSPTGRGLQWAGHCNGWAAAAILEEEPIETRVFGGVTFTVGDQKGLLSDLHFADSALWSYGGDDEEVDPADFHRVLIDWLARQKRAMIMTFRLGNEEVWSYPAYRVELVYGPDPEEPDWSDVEATVWQVDNDVVPDFVGARDWPSSEGKLFTYRIKGPADNPTEGAWTQSSASGRFSHPYQIWYPDQSQRQADRALIAPGLNEETVREITGMQSPTSTPTPALRPSATRTPIPTITPAPASSPTSSLSASPTSTATRTPSVR